MIIIDRGRRHHADATSAVETALPALHREVFEAALRAPSAHNAQPWRIRVLPGPRYELHYDHHEYLPADPDDRDAYLCMGAFLETLHLAALRVGLAAASCLVLDRSGRDLHVADVELVPAGAVEPLADALPRRATNRSRYTSEPLTPALILALQDYGASLVPVRVVARIVHRASTLSWRDRRFVGDLAAWTRADPSSPDGMTPRQLGLARYEWFALRVAYRLGRLPRWLAPAYGKREVRLLGEAPAVAVLSADSEAPADLVAAGRRLLRAWVTICDAGFGYHPISVAIDRPETRPEIAALAGGDGTPVALFRVGRPTAPANPSNRVGLADALIP